jgi:hypothetical protein
MTHIVKLLLIITGSGLLGGLTNFFLLYDSESKNEVIWINLIKSILLSLCASITVPLFLQIISNNLIDLPTNNTFPGKNYLILAGFCVLAAVYSKRFLEDLYSKVNKAEAKAEEAKKVAKEAEKYIESNLEDEQNEQGTISTKSNPTKSEVIKKKIESIGDILDIDINTYLRDNAEIEIKSVLNNLQNSKYRDRSIQGISKSTNINPNHVAVILKAFLHVNIVSEIRWYGKIFYRLTPQGKETQII